MSFYFFQYNNLFLINSLLAIIFNLNISFSQDSTNVIELDEVNLNTKMSYTFNEYYFYEKKVLKQLKDIQFDIVIDDGFHSFKTMKYFIKNYFKLLKPGGIGVIEDIGLDGIATIEKLKKVIKRTRLKGEIFEYDFDNDLNYHISRAKNTKPHDKMIVFELENK